MSSLCICHLYGLVEGMCIPMCLSICVLSAGNANMLTAMLISKYATAWQELGLDFATQPLTVFDVIARQHVRAKAVGAYSATVGAHDVAFVRLRNG